MATQQSGGQAPPTVPWRIRALAKVAQFFRFLRNINYGAAWSFCVEFCVAHPKGIRNTLIGIVAAFIVLPIIWPPIVYLHSAAKDWDWERSMNPPQIYYISNVDTTDCPPELQEKLKRWNPQDRKAGETMRQNILMAARAADIRVDEVVPYDPSLIPDDGKFIAIVFESVMVTDEEMGKLERTQPATAEKDSVKAEADEDADLEETEEAEEAEAKPQFRLIVYFISPNPDSKFWNTSEDSEDKTKDDEEGRFRVVVKAAPKDLDLHLGFLADGFSTASGNPVDMKKLLDFLDRQRDKEELPLFERGG